MYGENWIIKGLPKNIYTRAKSDADERNYDNISNGDTENTVTEWDYVTLKECKMIVTSGSHWTEVFEELSTRPEEEKLSGGKDAKTNWLSQIEVMSNKLNMPTSSYSVSNDEFSWLRSIFNWLFEK